MDHKSVYNGIELYEEKNNKITEITFLSIIFILILIAVFYFGIKMVNRVNIKGNILNPSQIQYFIDIADEASRGKGQVNWQEVAAISEVYGQGDVSLVSDTDNRNIANSFILDKGDGSFNLLSMEEVMAKLNYSQDEQKKAADYLEKLSTNCLYEGLYDEREKVDFINSLEKPADENYKTYGVLPSITMAQAILESGWGSSELATKYNNLFGIKADDRWGGEVATITTKENYSDVVEANFRQYNSILESIEDHGRFLAGNERYTVNGVFTAKDYKSQAQALQNAGYSTAKDESGNLIYAQKLISIIQNYNLMIYDSKIQK